MRDKESINICETSSPFKDDDSCLYLSKIIYEKGFYKIVGLDYYASLPKAELPNLLEPEEEKIVAKVTESNLEKCWLVVRSLKDHYNEKGYKLCIGDILKLGRVKFKIKEIRHDDIIETLNSENKEDEKSNEMHAEICNIVTEQDGEYISDYTCRICLCENFTNDNPLVNLCACSGTVKYMHIKCLQNWLKARLNIRSTNLSISYYWKNFDCELCKKAYPNTISYNCGGFKNKKDLVYIPRPPSENYLILEAIARDRRSSGGVHIICLGKNKNLIKLGRGSDSDIRISDISVSRCHAIISFRQNGYYVEDNISKFGTLVRVKRPILLDNHNNNISLQIGRTVLSFNIRKTHSMSNQVFMNFEEDLYDDDKIADIKVDKNQIMDKYEKLDSKKEPTPTLLNANPVNGMDINDNKLLAPIGESKSDGSSQSHEDDKECDDQKLDMINMKIVDLPKASRTTLENLLYYKFYSHTDLTHPSLLPSNTDNIEKNICVDINYNNIYNRGSNEPEEDKKNN